VPIPPHLWIHVVRHGPAGIAAALVFFGKAPLVTVPHTDFSRFPATTVETPYGLFGATGWSTAQALLWAVIAFVVVQAVALLVEHGKKTAD